MKLLPEEIRKNGFNYTQVIRGQRAYVYEQCISRRVKRYEVFLIQLRPAQEIFGRHYPEREVFPSNEDFGYTAWAITNLERALEKYHQLEGAKQIIKDN